MDLNDNKCKLVREALFLEDIFPGVQLNSKISNINNELCITNNTLTFENSDISDTFQNIDNNNYPNNNIQQHIHDIRTTDSIQENENNNTENTDGQSYTNNDDINHTKNIENNDNEIHNDSTNYTNNIIINNNNTDKQSKTINRNRSLFTNDDNNHKKIKRNPSSINHKRKRNIEDVENIIYKKIKNIDSIPQILRKRPHTSTDKSDPISNKRIKSLINNKEFNNISHINSNKNKISAKNTIQKIPKKFNEAINSNEKKEWLTAIKNELDNLYANKIMTFTKRIPKNTNIISSKWVFTVKRDENNNITKYKARLVARGYKQQKGIDYDITYSPTLNTDSIKLIIALAAKFKWNIQQLDIKAAYLNANIDKTLYIQIPKGDKNFKKGFWRLNRALYGLKQAGRQWFLTISKFLRENGYTQLSSEPCIFKKVINNKLVGLIGLYVDDMMITGNNREIRNIISKLKKRFKISNCEPLRYILGIKIEKDHNDYIISQTHAINTLLEKYNITNIKKQSTPCTGDNLISENKKPFNTKIFKSAIGSLIYIAKITRPDISFAVHKIARKSESPTVSDWNKVLNIFKYLNATKDYKLRYNGKGNFIGYTDSDFAGDLEDRKSTSGHIILIGNSPICWGSKKQSIVATSTTEAEYIATSECVKKVLWIRNILKELLNFKKPITIFTDNTSSLKTIKNGELNSKLKHISIKYYFNKDNINQNKIDLKYIPTDEMLADTLTKNQNGSQIKKFTKKIFEINNNNNQNNNNINYKNKHNYHYIIDNNNNINKRKFNSNDNKY